MAHIIFLFYSTATEIADSIICLILIPTHSLNFCIITVFEITYLIYYHKRPELRINYASTLKNKTR